jgi:hypothetical protein
MFKRPFFSDNDQFLFLFVGIIMLSMLFLLFHADIVYSTSENKSQIPMYMLSTRDIASYKGMEGHGYDNSNYSFLNIVHLFNRCPSEVTIFVHGWNNNETIAKERLDRVKMALEQNNYTSPLIGFSWKSDSEWNAAKSIAKWNGPILANFTANLMDKCKKAQPQGEEFKIRLIAHSLGARVVLSSLDSLQKNPIWNKNNSYITSVDFLGAAVDDEEISKIPGEVLNDFTNLGTLKSDYGNAIEEEVISFNNYFNPSDKVLGPNSTFPHTPFQMYPSFEGDMALGFNGFQSVPKITLPKNYVQVNVTDQIKNISDADGRAGEDLGLCFPAGELFQFPCKVKNEGWDYGLCDFINKSCHIDIGYNHAGYLGYRNTTDTTKLVDDGAIDIVVKNWNWTGS